MKKKIISFGAFILLTIVMSALFGCKAQTCVVANTDTLIGIEAIYQPDLNLPVAKLGYARHEMVIVPTNRVSDDNPTGIQGQGARDSANVITEFNFTNFFSFWRSNGIYQRIAVGDIAVTQPGASMMFAKDETGQISAAAAEAIKSLSAKSDSSDTSLPEKTKLKTQLLKLCKDEAVKAKVLAFLKEKGSTWDDFIDDRIQIAVEEIKKLIEEITK